MTNENDSLESIQIGGRELSKIFENIDDEISLAVANAKFNFTMGRTNEKDLKIVFAYIKNTRGTCYTIEDSNEYPFRIY